MRKLKLRPQNNPSILSKQLQLKEESQRPLYVWHSLCLALPSIKNNSPQHNQERKKARPVDPYDSPAQPKTTISVGLKLVTGALTGNSLVQNLLTNRRCNIARNGGDEWVRRELPSRVISGQKPGSRNKTDWDQVYDLAQSRSIKSMRES